MKFDELNIYKIGNSIQMAGVVYAGEGKMLLCLFPDDSGEVLSSEHKPCLYPKNGSEPLRVETLNMSHEEWKTFLLQTDRVETEIFTKASDGTLAKALFRKSQRNIDTSVQWKVFHRDGFRCRYCGKGEGTPLTVDHLVLHSNGGPNVEENLVASCKPCNKKRGDMPYVDWLNHPHYLRVSQGLSANVREANASLVSTLNSIPRVNVRSR